MAVPAMSLDGVMLPGVATPGVVTMRDDLQVPRVAAVPHAAQVVERETFGNLASEVLVRDAVRQPGASAWQTDRAVAVRAARTFPEPAPVRVEPQASE